jgi:hypothetical protein
MDDLSIHQKDSCAPSPSKCSTGRMDESSKPTTSVYSGISIKYTRKLTYNKGYEGDQEENDDQHPMLMMAPLHLAMLFSW